MSALAVIAMAAGLVLAHTLRGAKGGFRLMHGAAFLAALCVTALVVRFFAMEADIERRSDYDRFVAHGLQTAQESDAPLWVFVGASYSRNAISADMLTERLLARGMDVQVINLSLEGASLQERRTHLEDFLSRSPRKPARVFLEVAPEFDADPVYVFQIAKFSNRAIDQFDLSNTLAASGDIAARHCGGLVACAKAAALTGSHGLMNALNIGLLFSGEDFAGLDAREAFDPQVSPRKGLSDARLEEMSPPARGARLTERLDDRAPYAWGQDYRTDLIIELEASGIATALYFPPAIDPAKRAYGRGVCAATPDKICIIADDPNLLAALDADVWFDPGHLLVPGAAIYMDWLADRLVEVAE